MHIDICYVMLRSEQIIAKFCGEMEVERRKIDYVSVLMCVDCYWIGNEAQNW